MAVAKVLEGYVADSPHILGPFESVSSADVYAPMAEHLPTMPSRFCDIGAGTGRDAAWFAAQGHDVLAVEPTDVLREAGEALHRSPRISWLKDALPDLPRLIERGETFDRVTMSGVWHHLEEAERAAAMPRLARLVAPGGMLIFSLRHGPGAESRPCFPSRAEEEIARGEAVGFRLVASRLTNSVLPSNRAAGVTRTWLALRR